MVRSTAASNITGDFTRPEKLSLVTIHESIANSASSTYMHSGPVSTVRLREKGNC